MQSFLGSGDLYLDRLTEAGVRTGLFFGGNAEVLSIQSNAEIKEQISKGRNDYGQVKASATLNQPAKIKISLNQLDGDNLAMAFLGKKFAIDIASGSVSAELLTILTVGKYQRLAKRGITESSLVVNMAEGVSASAWASETSKEVGDLVVPTTPNGHYYECTTAGDTGTTEPTWPEDGSTVSDGSAVWTDKGTIALVKDEDFEITARTGMIRAIDAGRLSAGDELSINYDYPAQTGFKIQGAVQPTIKAYVFLDGKNITNGKDIEMEAWEVQLKPTTPVDFLASDFTSLELEGTLKAPDGYDEPFIVRQFD